MRTPLVILLIAAGAACSPAEVVDSVVATVNGRAIKHSDVLREIRLTAFLNHGEADVSPAVQKETVNRLIEQAIIRQEIEAGAFSPPDPLKGEDMLRTLQETYKGKEAFREAMASRGIDESTLRKHLEWQAAVLHFVQLRFGQAGTGDDPQARPVNDRFFAWLDQMRKEQRIVIREGRLQ